MGCSAIRITQPRVGYMTQMLQTCGIRVVGGTVVDCDMGGAEAGHPVDAYHGGLVQFLKVAAGGGSS